MIDLMKIARTEADGGDLFNALSQLFEKGDMELILQMYDLMRKGNVVIAYKNESGSILIHISKSATAVLS